MCAMQNNAKRLASQPWALFLTLFLAARARLKTTARFLFFVAGITERSQGASLGFTPLDLTERGITHLASVPNFNVFVKLLTKNKPNVSFVVASTCLEGD